MSPSNDGSRARARGFNHRGLTSASGGDVAKVFFLTPQVEQPRGSVCERPAGLRGLIEECVAALVGDGEAAFRLGVTLVNLNQIGSPIGTRRPASSMSTRSTRRRRRRDVRTSTSAGGPEISAAPRRASTRCRNCLGIALACMGANRGSRLTAPSFGWHRSPSFTDPLCYGKSTRK
jgi:hypothetical protein